MNKFHRSVTQKIFPDEPNHSEIVRFVLQIMFELVEALIHTEECSNRVKTHGKLKSYLGTLQNSYRERFPTGRKNLFIRQKILPSEKILPTENCLENP